MSKSITVNDIPFVEQLYLLSTIVPVENRRNRSTPVWLLERMQLLDGIALLLCTGKKKEPTAVTFEETGGGTNFYYSKNRPCDEQEKNYVSGLLEIVKNSVRYDQCIRSVLHHAIPACQGKLESRLDKVAHEIQTLQESSSDGSIAFNSSESFENHIRTILGDCVPDDMQMDVFLQIIVRAILGVSPEETGDMEFLLKMVHFIGVAEDIHTVMPYPVLVWRLQKLGDFFGAAKNIAWITTFDREVAPRKKLMTFTEVCPPPPVLQAMAGNPIQILNKFAEAKGKNTITLEALKNVYKDFKDKAKLDIDAELPRLQEVENFVHCELTLLNFMVKRRLATRKKKYASMTIEIGSTKRTCWACQIYMEEMESLCMPPRSTSYPSGSYELNCVVSEYSGKITAGWEIPTSSPKKFDRLAPERIVSRKIENIIDHVHERQNYDSNWEVYSTEGLRYVYIGQGT